MRKIVVGMTLLLAVTGVALVVAGAFGREWRGGSLVSLVHIWGGLFFAVIFPLYAWDHIQANRRWLRAWSWVSASGVVQAAAAVLIILTGITLYLYGAQAWAWLRDLHHWPTYPLVAALAVHYLSPKRPGETSPEPVTGTHPRDSSSGP